MQCFWTGWLAHLMLGVLLNDGASRRVLLYMCLYKYMFMHVYNYIELHTQYFFDMSCTKPCFFLHIMNESFLIFLNPTASFTLLIMLLNNVEHIKLEIGKFWKFSAAEIQLVFFLGEKTRTMFFFSIVKYNIDNNKQYSLDSKL